MKKLSDRDLVAKEYATIDRLGMRRLDRTAWLGGESEPWLLTLAAIAEVRPTRILDAGCGSGDFAAMLTAPDVRYVDLSPAAVDAARARGLRAEVADIQNLPFPDSSFDVAVSNWVLYHVPDRARAITPSSPRCSCQPVALLGCYNAPGHLQELWSKVEATVDADDFNADDGQAELQRSFRQVQVREAHGQVLWETRERVRNVPRRLPRDVRPTHRAGRSVSLPRDQAKRRSRRRIDEQPTHYAVATKPVATIGFVTTPNTEVGLPSFADLPAVISHALFGGGEPPLADLSGRYDKVVLVVLDGFGRLFLERHARHPLVQRFQDEGVVVPLRSAKSRQPQQPT